MVLGFMEAGLFPIAEYWWFYAGFTLFVVSLLALDLGVFHRDAHAVTFREAATWSVVWVILALLFAFGFYRFALWKFANDPRLQAIPGFDAAQMAAQSALEFLAGYVTEYSLSVDNIFVFVVVFGYFAIPARYQHRVLFFGILGALVFRAVFIAMGSLLLRFHWVLLVFGGFLILTGLRMLFLPEKELDPESNPVLRLFRRFVPLTPDLHGQNLMVKINGGWHATPLLLTLVFLEMTDVLFAVDSVPAIFALTREPMIVFTSNMFAILGLRSMYFMLAGAVNKFHLLKYGLAIVLIFVGLKMVWLDGAFGGKFPIAISLGLIVSILATSVIVSLLFPKAEPTAGESSGT